MGNNNEVEVQGKGTIAVDTKYGKNIIIHDVMFIPGLKQNLISVGQLMRNGYFAIFDDDKYEVYEKKTGKMVIAVKMTKNKMFPLQFSELSLHALSIIAPDESFLWH